MLERIVFPSLVFISWRSVIILFQIFIQPQYLITSSSDTLIKRLFTSWTSYWDGAHYLSIAASGYHFPQQAFFPLWPLLIKLGTLVYLSGEFSSFLFTFILGLLNFILFYLLAKKLIGGQRAKWALVIFASYPATIFLHTGYSENLFLFSAMLSFWFLEKGNYFLSAISGGFSTACRMAGIALISSPFFAKTNFKKRIMMIFLTSLGLLFYMLFLYLNYNDPLYFIKGQLAWCQNAGRCGFMSPFAPLWNYGKLILSGQENISFFSFRFNDWLSSIIFLSFLPLVWKKLPKHYFIYSLIVLFMPLTSGTTTSMTRVTLTIFPVFFVIPYFLKSKFIKIILSLALIMLQLRFVLLFSSFMWVA